MRNEQARYLAVQHQIEQFMGEAVQSRNPIASILWGQLISEMVEKNEQSRQGYEARVGIVTALGWRIQAKSAEPVNEWRELLLDEQRHLQASPLNFIWAEESEGSL